LNHLKIVNLFCLLTAGKPPLLQSRWR